MKKENREKIINDITIRFIEKKDLKNFTDKELIFLHILDYIHGSLCDLYDSIDNLRG